MLFRTYRVGDWGSCVVGYRDDGKICWRGKERTGRFRSVTINLRKEGFRRRDVGELQTKGPWGKGEELRIWVFVKYGLGQGVGEMVKGFA